MNEPIYKNFDDTVFISILPPQNETHNRRLCIGIRKKDLQQVRVNIKDYNPRARGILNKLIPSYNVLYFGYDSTPFVGRNFEFFTKDRRRIFLHHIEEVMQILQVISQ
jgi:hypothetical protein